jgi:excisionase family DNA binding protein
MNLKTAAARLSIHYQTAYKLVRSGALAAVKIGGTYEISEAALERYRAERDLLRSGAAAPRADVAPPRRDRASAIADAHAVAECTTTNAYGVFETVAWVAAETVGDTAVVRAKEPAGFLPVAFHDADPRRRAALASLVQGFGTVGPVRALERVRATKRSLLIPHVPQDILRASVDAQHRQFLDQLGVHSLVLAPVIVRGEVEAVVTLSRSTPGAPYTTEDVEFAEAMASALELALARADAYQQGWERRRELVGAVRRAIADGTSDANGVLREERFAEVVYDLRGHVFANRTTRRLTNGDASVLINGFAHHGPDDAADRLSAGDLEYHDDERDLPVPGGTTRRFVVHRGLVRDDTARPRALVIVAQPLPVAS